MTRLIDNDSLGRNESKHYVGLK